MAVRREAAGKSPAIAAAAFAVLGLAVVAGCAQAPRAAGDPVYGSLTPRAEVLARNTLQEALETAHSKTSLTWTYVEDGSQGQITPLRTYRTTAGYYCREYVEVVQTSVEGQTRRQRTACRDDDGLWKPVSS